MFIQRASLSLYLLSLLLLAGCFGEDAPTSALPKTA